MRSSTHVSYKLTAASVNAGRVKAHRNLWKTGQKSGMRTVDRCCSIRRESGPNLGSLLVAFVITFTVTGSVALGIALAYTSVLGLLHAFAQSTRKPQPAPVLVLSQTHVSGD
jgi:hypothetical protein